MTKLLPLPKAEPWQEPYFLILYLWYYSVGHYQLVPLGEYRFDSKLTALLSQSALTLPQLTGAVYTLITNPEKSLCQSPATFYPHLWTRPHLLELLNLGQKLNLNSEQDPLPFSGWNHALILREADSYTRHFKPLPCELRGILSMKPTELQLL